MPPAGFEPAIPGSEPQTALPLGRYANNILKYIRSVILLTVKRCSLVNNRRDLSATLHSHTSKFSSNYHVTAVGTSNIKHSHHIGK
jgi:hypothetical protein